MLFIFTVCITGCSSALDNTYGSGHIPPGESSTYDKKTPAYNKKHLATQRPYEVKGERYTPIHSATGFVQTGKASWYGSQFHGRKTSNGERYNMYDMTAAHKTLPMNTWVSVHNLENNKKIIVRINDRGPFIAGRIIDLSYTGAKRIGIVGPGTAQVRVTALGQAASYSEKTKTPVTFTPLDYWKGNFTVQIGAFKVKTNAEKYRDKLSKTYENAHIETFTDDRGTFYRVRIGRFSNLQDAITFSEKIITQGFGSAFAVAE
ncbi:MAG: septal ring lytic transglycosylase RlpA family protein [Proteobacteria bacterium]|nr:septal ring lytic transglycosylase RlpA family protein [Pseudomonadota bacterium]MBU1388683.1 septal ring lytic transglycosylase RlpA family protein [Pseudomonadota bacterium]MBU1541893.1 septal ring lytic transglycosylase RlpA family protein [Pseudomonadota bacterium]MBU2481478.1 septal ring lytic transglycosylase RlpA family protein [Pseudomonadota bacterium]